MPAVESLPRVPHRFTNVPSVARDPAVRLNTNFVIGTSGTELNVVVKRVLFTTLMWPIRSKATCPRRATTRSGYPGWFLTKYTLPRSGALSSGVDATADPAFACVQWPASYCAGVHALAMTFRRAFSVLGRSTRTQRRFAFPLGIVSVVVSGTVEPVAV